MARAKIHRGGKLRSGKKVDAKKGEEKSQIESLENSFASLNTITTIKTIESIPSSIPPEM